MNTAKALFYILFRFQLRLRFRVADLLQSRTKFPPIPPAALRFRVGESLSIPEFLRIGQGCAEVVATRLKESGVDLHSQQRVLDFGCGCGRILRWLSPAYPEVNWNGVDVDAEPVRWCNEHLRPVRGTAIAADPPLPFASEYFDAIYCFSVFTHLDERMQDSWLRELRRVLKPKGILFLTVHGCVAAEAGLDETGKRQLALRGFLHRTSSKLKGLVPERYHTTWHTQQYITAKVSGIVGECSYEVVADGIQDIVISRRSACSRPVIGFEST